MKSTRQNIRNGERESVLKPSQALMFAPDYSKLDHRLERKGVVYTKDWVVEFILGLAGYVESQNLVDSVAIEPAAGEGAFLIPMARRLVASCREQNRPLSDCRGALIAFELDEHSAGITRDAVVRSLTTDGVSPSVATDLASHWVRSGDYLFEAFRLPQVDFVIGNPPYVRLEDIPDNVARLYRSSYPTMMGRADLYVAFYEASLRQLRSGGVCVFVCADRWMLNQYGAELRSLVTSAYAVEAVIEMHQANVFHDDVSAYPAITVIRKGPQKNAVVASANPEAEAQAPQFLTNAIQTASTQPNVSVPGLTIATVKTWFSNSDPWPCSSPNRLQLLRRIEEEFGLLESERRSTKVGIGVATGLDEVFITKDASIVESSRLLPLALARDTVNGRLEWSGHHLVDPWESEGLVNLAAFPRLEAYFVKHEKLLKKRHTAKKNSMAWYRTIDRVTHSLTGAHKLYIPDIKDAFNPVLDIGQTYPHHNLYYIQSDVWDLEVLGGILLSAISQLFIEAYGVRMRGGYLRFQAQYLRRIRVPNFTGIPQEERDTLRTAFRVRDRQLATEVALGLYGIKAPELERALGY